jgi:rRNA-processing protein FCF1
MAPTPRRSPYEGTDRLIIDGTNLLYRLGAGAGGPAPASAIVGRIRGAVPVTVAIDLVFDGIGHGVYGRLAQKMIVRYSGRKTGDETILDLASEATMEGGGGPSAADRVLVVTNDRDLRDKLAAKGVRTAPLQWLIARLDVPAPSPTAARPATIGQGKAPRSSSAGPRDDDRKPWKPGRGATAKTGAPKKVARHKRHPRAGA